MRNILLLTSTIAPRAGVTELVRTDPEARLADYRTALAFYLDELAKGTIDEIVYADNSEYPLDALEAQVAERGLADRVHFQSFGAKAAPDSGRFYLETELIRTALSLPPLDSLEADARIWKVTGRYIVWNLKAIIASMPSDAELYVNCRNKPLRWTDFYIVAFTRGAFERLLSEEEHARYLVPMSGEMILRDRIDSEAFSDMRIVRRMRTVPRIDGVRGFDGARYADLKTKARYLARVVAARVAPGLWI